MHRLDEMQVRFRDAVVRGETTPIVPALLGGHNPEQRLKVHQRNYQTSLTEALRAKFPATEWLVGSAFLTEAAKTFIRSYPPIAPCIAEYGAMFPAFLANYDGAGSLPYLEDFAKLEWCVGKVAIAVDQPSIDRTTLCGIDTAALLDTTLTLQSGVQYQRAGWSVDELMTIYLTDTAPDQLMLTPADLGIEVSGARGEFRLKRLNSADFIFRKLVSDGLSIGNAAECALNIDPDFDPGRALAMLVAADLVTAIGRHNLEDEQ